MAIITYPLNGIEYTANDAETYLCTRTSGVYSADNHFQPSVTGNREVTISPGLAWIRNAEYCGKSIYNSAPVAVTIPVADGGLPRIDRIVLRFDKAANSTSIAVKKGTATQNPTAPNVEQTELIYELGLCTVDIPASSIIVSEADITSTLMDENVCGVMRDGVTGLPSQALFDEFNAKVERIILTASNKLDEATVSFNAWVENLKENIGESAVYVGAVPITRKVNGHELSSDVILDADDIEAVPNSRTINNQSLSNDIVLTPDDINSVPITRTVNNKPLSNDIVLNANDIGIIFSTVDLEEGVSKLETGKVYLVYE